MSENQSSADAQLDQAPPQDSIIPTISIDNLIFGFHEGQLSILLVKHSQGESAGCWALPGGRIRYNENLRDAASRHLLELTGIKGLYLEQLKTFGQVNRYPKGRIITVSYYALVSAEKFELAVGHKTEDVCWFNIRELPELIYDHSDILQYGIKQLQQNIRRQPIGFNLLPEKFTLLQLQELYESILGIKLDKPNFRRKIMKMNLLINCEEKEIGVSHRAAKLYRFDEHTYHSLTRRGFSFEV
ncbi:NUDIX hydrolase [Gilvimarinus agarilyticus]|uniref:NUDIX hydrolase n=1 Tax=unclassified Gilvimarinus TaxID=2642066 RepID=UPI001C0A4B1F|nr:MULTISPECIES: NUDIX domain-containing protein [unclassified Gilvimarinus]MBU2885533.1 NUDIX hydrolase [Gilvimarinus agarilyticus]MDO6570432.1 NUDIX domain-containing protein [Gilvimarinus sp. 2_MG-2023]MDO6748386.1 NUDIX domain-containing protein [Gilvimarinus sp. 1_MG-2023]